MLNKLKKSIIPMLKCLTFVSVIVLCTVSCGSVAQQKYTSHSVQKGETVYSIAQENNISEDIIYNLNPDAKNGLKVNSVLIIPETNTIKKNTSHNPKYRQHRVKRKETLYGIAKEYNVSVDDIKKLNKELYSRGLKNGEKLIIPPNPKHSEGPIGNNSLTPGTQEYTVKPKETKFGIARKFGISIAELDTLNLDMGESLKVGSVIIVPDETVIDEPEMDTENFQYYEVKPKEGFYRMKVKFGLSEEEIVTLNPFAKEGLKDGMILKLPKKGILISPENITEVDLTKKIKNKKMKTIALMLPFCLNNTKTDSTKTDEDLIKKDPILRVTLDFYSGALMAAEFAKDNGISVTLDVYDTEKTESKVTSIISNNDFKKTDAVIGPLMQKNVEKASALLEDKKIPVFSPLSNREMSMNSNFFQTLPTDAVLERIMISYIREHASGKNILIIADSKHQKQKNEILAAIPEAKVVSQRKDGYLQSADVNSAVRDGVENWVILESANPILVSSAVGVLSSMPHNYKVRLFTLNKNDAYEWHEISSTRLAKLNFTFPAVNRNITEVERQPFLTSYKNKYGVLPNRYAIRGFDVTYDVLLRLASDNDIYDAILPENVTSYVENKFRYQKTITEGYRNEAAYILKYNDKLEFDEVK